MLSLLNDRSFIACNTEAEQADLIYFGAPFDGTCSYRPGTRFGPDAVRRESFGIETYSPYLDADLEAYRICDLGDLEFPFGNTERVLDMVQGQTAEILESGKTPLMFGGEHLLSLGFLRALLEVYPDLHILHFDAHTDLRDEYLGEKLSHASVMRRAWELLGDGRIHSFGIRSGMREEFEWARQHIDFHPFTLEGLEPCLRSIAPAPLYLSFDLDILDPAELPGTGTPEAGGLRFNEIMSAYRAILQHANLIAADLLELSPILDTSGRSTALACKLCRETMILLSLCREKRRL